MRYATFACWWWTWCSEVLACQGHSSGIYTFPARLLHLLAKRWLQFCPVGVLRTTHVSGHIWGERAVDSALVLVLVSLAMLVLGVALPFRAISVFLISGLAASAVDTSSVGEWQLTLYLFIRCLWGGCACMQCCEEWELDLCVGMEVWDRVISCGWAVCVCSVWWLVVFFVIL